MTEKEFLDRESRLARAELNKSARKLKADVDTAFDVERLIRSHPVLSLGIGAAAGFLIGDQLGSRRHGHRGVLRTLGVFATRPLMSALNVLIRPGATPPREGADPREPSGEPHY